MNLLKKIFLVLKSKKKKIVFKNSKQYWEERYSKGGNSGAGSYDQLANFKAEVLNKFVSDQAIESVIEFGCGDGNQLQIARYPRYLGYDVSQTAIANCRHIFSGDRTKEFKHVDEFKDEKADLTISLDVIYHLVEDSVFETYINQLFSSSSRYVIIYSSNVNLPKKVHVRQRRFTPWIEKNIKGWKLIRTIPNRYPYDEMDQKNTSFSDFFIYQKI